MLLSYYGFDNKGYCHIMGSTTKDSEIKFHHGAYRIHHGAYRIADMNISEQEDECRMSALGAALFAPMSIETVVRMARTGKICRYADLSMGCCNF